MVDQAVAERTVASRAPPLAKRPSLTDKTDCALKAALPGKMHMDVIPKAKKNSVYGLQFSAVGHLSETHERLGEAGDAAALHRVCVNCLNDNKDTMMKIDKDFPCACCYRTCVLKRSRSVFCAQCKAALAAHEKDSDNLKEFFFAHLMKPVGLKYPRWEFKNLHEWRTIGEYEDRRREKRCDAVIVAQNVLGSQHVLLAVEFVLTADITDESLRDKRRALQKYATQNPGVKIVFVIAHQTHKSSEDNSDVALAEMVVLRQWLTAALLTAASLPDGDRQMTLITLGASATQRDRLVIRSGRHLPALCRPQHQTHQWAFAVHWKENSRLDIAFDKRPNGSPLTRKEETASIFGCAGLLSTDPAGDAEAPPEG